MEDYTVNCENQVDFAKLKQNTTELTMEVFVFFKTTRSNEEMPVFKFCRVIVHLFHFPITVIVPVPRQQRIPKIRSQRTPRANPIQNSILVNEIQFRVL